ncbi:ABC transporter permease [Aestuariivirga sp. YIM B02566]|uniref:ABC transporter permease n=1 Tax=Taklimakanibacter albus TaxID=2800327 RepID=A0ACC5R4L3_9HYPH|nr:ABC transporter permease [Aestuariivirga sp. YIM B02566]MBK1867605.1 ABC transporter permease [Aestuariivirga sp. YIM B02566]
MRKVSWSVARLYRWMLLAPALFLAAFFVFPIIRVVLRSFSDPAWGLQNYERIMAGGPYLQVLLATIQTAATVTALCLLLAYPVAYVMSRLSGSLLQIAAACVIIPLWTSAVIRSYAWMVVFQRKGILNEALIGAGVLDDAIRFLPGSFAVHVGMVHIMLPFMILPLLANMRAIDRSLLRAAEIMGANPLVAFAKVYFPLSMPGVSAGVALVFMMSLGFFITPALLGGPQHLMAAVLIEQQANVILDWGLASSLATVLLVVTGAMYVVYMRLTGNATGNLKGAL